MISAVTSVNKQEWKDLIAVALKVATAENGYSFVGWTTEAIAADLCAYNSDFEFISPYEVEKLLIEMAEDASAEWDTNHGIEN